MRRILFALVSVAAIVSFAPDRVAAQNKRGDRNLITRQDIDEGGASMVTAQDAVQRLRPQWLRPALGRNNAASMDGSNQNTPNATAPILYIDDRRQPELDLLRTVPATKVKEIKFMDQNRAVQMLGPGHEAGAILVTTEK